MFSERDFNIITLYTSEVQVVILTVWSIRYILTLYIWKTHFRNKKRRLSNVNSWTLFLPYNRNTVHAIAVLCTQTSSYLQNNMFRLLTPYIRIIAIAVPIITFVIDQLNNNNYICSFLKNLAFRFREYLWEMFRRHYITNCTIMR